MKLDDLVLLIKAGYTKADIEALGIAMNADPVPEVPADPVPEVPADPTPETPAQPDDDRLKQLETKLDYVVNRFNYMAVQNSKQPEEKAETIEDILASVIK